MTRPSAPGFTLAEVLVALALAALLLSALSGLIRAGLDTREQTSQQNALTREAAFAMERMVRAVRGTAQLVVPLTEDPGSMEIESIRDPGVLAVALHPERDRDLDGFADADNDGDGRVDEDLPGDTSNDGKSGLVGIDDDNNGFTDVSLAGSRDDDETGWFGTADDDPIDGLDSDGDSSIDEDPPADMNEDGAPGAIFVDDDADGSVDEGNTADDDEDGATDEDWLDAVVYFLSGSDLVERHPNLSPADGLDYTERTIASNVTGFRVERLPVGTRRTELVDLTLDLSAGLASISLHTRVRVGSGR